MRVPEDAIPDVLPTRAHRLPDGDLVWRVGAWPRMLMEDEIASGGALTSLLDKTAAKRAETGDARTVESVHAEVFGRLYGFDTERLPDEAVAKHARDWAAKLHEIAESLPEWASAAQVANGDSWLAGIGTARIGEALLEHLPPLPEDPADLESELEGLHQLAQGKKRIPKKIRKRMSDLGERLAAIEETARAATEALTKDSSALRVAIARAAAAATKEMEEAEEMAAGLGCDASDAKHERSEVHMALRDERVRKIAELAGRMRDFVTTKKRAKGGRSADEVVSVELGSDLRRLLPSELMTLGIGGLGAAMLYGKLLDQRAQQYEVQATEKPKRGPILLLIDESGSMSGARDVWAKAFALGLMQRAIEERRPFRVIHYSTTTTVDSFDNPARAPMGDVLRCVRSFLNGGTKIGAALDVAALQLTGATARADVVLITDGEDYDTSAIERGAASVRERGGFIYTVAIECPVPGALASVSDDTVSFNEQEIRSGVFPPDSMLIGRDEADA